MKRMYLGISAFVAIFVVHASDSIVVPNDRVNQAGNEAITQGFTGPGTFQQLYSSSQFTGPILITGIAFRPDETFSVSSVHVVIPQLTVRLSTFSKSAALFSTSYSANKGLDEAVVFDSSVDWRSTDMPGSTPNNFDFKIPLSRSFVFDPSNGSLLMSFSANGASGNAEADTHSSGNAGIGMMALNGGVIPGYVLITEFEVVAVPEPRVGVLIMVGLLGALYRGRRA
jgi:hypothetical protein